MIREFNEKDFHDLLKLNNDSVPAVNHLSKGELKNILRLSEKCWVADIDDELAASLIIIGPNQPYQSDNYTWLETKFSNFCYVDRIMVSEKHKRKKLGYTLYNKLEDHAEANGVSQLLCEVNIEPPNPQSIAFHTQLGWEPFFERQHAPDKKVQYFKKGITPVQD